MAEIQNYRSLSIDKMIHSMIQSGRQSHLTLFSLFSVQKNRYSYTQEGEIMQIALSGSIQVKTPIYVGGKFDCRTYKFIR